MTDKIQKWAYRRVVMNMDVTDESKVLSDLGENGWELVTILPADRSDPALGLDWPVAWMKRTY